MKVLVLGGTKFVGRHIVEALLARGDDVSIFSRGQTNPDLFDGISCLIGDRLGDASALSGTNWDLVIDTSAYVPRAVDTTSAHLRSNVENYVFISTISVYKDPPPGSNETAPQAELSDSTTETVDAESYGGLKVLCENTVMDNFPNATIVRPGLLIGPHDHTDRFPYWVWRCAQPGPLPLPAVRKQAIQLLDARDLAAFAVSSIGKGQVFNATGKACTFGDVIDTCIEAGGRVAEPIWLAPAHFKKAEIEPWKHLPLVTSFEGENDGMMNLDSSSAYAQGLSLRPLLDSTNDTNTWLGDRNELLVGMSCDQEKKVLELRS